MLSRSPSSSLIRKPENLTRGSNHGGHRLCVYVFVTTRAVSGCNRALLCWNISAIHKFSAPQCTTHARFSDSMALLCGKVACCSSFSVQQCTAGARGVHRWCNPTGHRLYKQNTFHVPVCKSGPYPDSLTHRVCMNYTPREMYTVSVPPGALGTCSVHFQCTNHVTVHVQCTMSLHPPGHGAHAFYNLITLCKLQYSVH